MSTTSIADRTRLRAQKLKREAENCLSLAVSEPSHEFAADLIEEAAMLMQRASELADA